MVGRDRLTTITTPEGAKAALRLPATERGFFFEVVGESHYQEALRRANAGSGRDRRTWVCLTAVPNNPADPNAVAVQSAAGETLGYLPRERAAQYQQIVLQVEARGLVPVCEGCFVGGGAKAIGIYLDLLDTPTIVADELGLDYKRVQRGPRRQAPGVEAAVVQRPRPARPAGEVKRWRVGRLLLWLGLLLALGLCGLAWAVWLWLTGSFGG